MLPERWGTSPVPVACVCQAGRSQLRVARLAPLIVSCGIHVAWRKLDGIVMDRIQML
jgi:hypothetical protein